MFLPRTLTLCSLSQSAETCRENKTGAARSPCSPLTDRGAPYVHSCIRGEKSGGEKCPSVSYSARRMQSRSERVRQNEKMQRQREDGLTIDIIRKGKSRRERKSRSRQMGGRLDRGWEFLCLSWSVPHCRHRSSRAKVPPSLLFSFSLCDLGSFNNLI